MLIFPPLTCTNADTYLAVVADAEAGPVHGAPLLDDAVVECVALGGQGGYLAVGLQAPEAGS